MKIRKRSLPSGSVSWSLDYGVIEGRRRQVAFKTRKLAESALAEARSRRVGFGASALAFSLDKQAEYEAAVARLVPFGVSLSEALDFYCAHARPMGARDLSVAEAADLFYARKEAMGRRKRYVGQLKVSVGSFVLGHGALAVHGITGEQVSGWLGGNGWSPRTQKGYFGDLKTFFAWAMGEKLCGLNPCEGIELPSLEEDEIEVLSVGACAALLGACAAGDPELLGYLVAGLFCGVRPDELRRSPGSSVDVGSKLVLVRGRSAKTRGRRTVDLSANALDWLALWVRPENGLICPVNFRNRWNRVRKAAGIGRWPHDGLRHTFASMHYAHHRNENLLQALMGHESAAMLFQHYRGLVTPTDAAAFWELRP